MVVRLLIACNTPAYVGWTERKIGGCDGKSMRCTLSIFLIHKKIKHIILNFKFLIIDVLKNHYCVTFFLHFLIFFCLQCMGVYCVCMRWVVSVPYKGGLYRLIFLKISPGKITQRTRTSRKNNYSYGALNFFFYMHHSFKRSYIF